jgi:hypothetical protein
MSCSTRMKGFFRGDAVPSAPCAQGAPPEWFTTAPPRAASEMRKFRDQGHPRELDQIGQIEIGAAGKQVVAVETGLMIGELQYVAGRSSKKTSAFRRHTISRLAVRAVNGHPTCPKLVDPIVASSVSERSTQSAECTKIGVGWVAEKCNFRGRGYQFVRQLQAFRHGADGERGYASHIALWSTQALDEAKLDQVCTYHEGIQSAASPAAARVLRAAKPPPRRPAA